MTEQSIKQKIATLKAFVAKRDFDTAKAFVSRWVSDDCDSHFNLDDIGKGKKSDQLKNGKSIFNKLELAILIFRDRLSSLEVVFMKSIINDGYVNKNILPCISELEDSYSNVLNETEKLLVKLSKK